MKRSTMLLVALGLILLTAGWWLFLIGPVNDRADQADMERTQALDEERLLRTQLQTLQRVQDNELPYRAAIADLQDSIPPTPQTAALIDDLAALAEETGVVWQSGTYGNPSEDEDAGYFEIPVAIVVEGQYFEILGYLFGISDMERLVRVDAISLSPQQDEFGFTILTVNVSARAFTTADVSIPTVEGEEGEDAAPDDDSGAEPADEESGA